MVNTTPQLSISIATILMEGVIVDVNVGLNHIMRQPFLKHRHV